MTRTLRRYSIGEAASSNGRNNQPLELRLLGPAGRTIDNMRRWASTISSFGRKARGRWVRSTAENGIQCFALLTTKESTIRVVGAVLYTFGRAAAALECRLIRKGRFKLCCSTAAKFCIQAETMAASFRGKSKEVT